MENKSDIELGVKSRLNSFYKVKGMQSMNAQVEDVDMSKRTVDVVVNTMNYLDSDGDILLPNCAEKSIKTRGVDSDATAKIKYAKDHNLNLIPGKWLSFGQKTVNYKGMNLLCLAGSVKMFDTQLGNDHLITYQEGGIDNHSIGFQYSDVYAIQKEAHGNSKQWSSMMDQVMNPDEMDKCDTVFVGKEINLFEGSSVAFGANSLTPYLGAKSGNVEGIKVKLFEKLQLLEGFLIKGTQSDEMMANFQLQIKQIKQFIAEMIVKDIKLSDRERALLETKQRNEEENNKPKSVSLGNFEIKL